MDRIRYNCLFNKAKNEATIIIIMGGNVFKRKFPLAHEGSDLHFNTVPEDEVLADEVILIIKEYNSQVNDPSDATEKLLEQIKSYFDKNSRRAFSGEFEINGRGEVFLAGTAIPLPNALVERIKDYKDMDLPVESLENFWRLCLLNPDERARQDLFKFTEEHELPITDNGYFIAYKSVIPKEDNEQLKAFVEQELEFADGIADRMYVYKKDRALAITTNLNALDEGVEVVGKLSELSEILQQEDKVVYTDIHSRTMTIEVGKVVEMERKDCDSNPHQDCSYGLHVGAVEYVNSFGRGYDGRAVLLCLVSPANVVAVPEYDSSKMRVCEYYVYGITEMENNEIVPIDTKYFEDDYAEIEVTKLKALIAEGDFTYMPTDVPLDVIEGIISNRVIVGDGSSRHNQLPEEGEDSGSES